MKKLVSFFTVAAFLFMAAACNDPLGPDTPDNPDKPDTPETPDTPDKPDNGPITIKIQLTEGGAAFVRAGIPVNLSGGTGYSADLTTSADGTVSATVPVGVYTATAFLKASVEGILYNYNGSQTITVVRGGDTQFSLPMTMSKTSQLIIKELYNGGCMDNSGTKNYINDKYIIIYNNSDTEVDASKMCIAMGQISNTKAQNKYATESGGLEYADQGWMPASYSIWWFQNGTEVKIAPYSQIVVAITGAIDHTVTYANSVDLSNADYCMYDRESGFNGAAQYPAPSASIPESHYMKTYVFGMGTSWPFPMLTAAPFLIIPDRDIEAFVKDPNNFDNRATNNSGNYAKVPVDWILDALDIWSAADETKFFGRFPASINTGYEVLVNKQGYTLYRNVDREATMAIPGNMEKLVFGYVGAVSEEDTDPANIDAEASIAKGATIIYMDTNNSATDFHVRRKASIKK